MDKEIIDQLVELDVKFSDMYKIVYGHRPRIDRRNWSTKDYTTKIEVLEKIIREKMQEEEKEHQESLISFKKKLKEAMISKDRDWKSALDDLMLSAGEKDIEHFLWTQGISSSKSSEIQNKYFGLD